MIVNDEGDGGVLIGVSKLVLKQIFLMNETTQWHWSSGRFYQ